MSWPVLKYLFIHKPSSSGSIIANFQHGAVAPLGILEYALGLILLICLPDIVQVESRM